MSSAGVNQLERIEQRTGARTAIYRCAAEGEQRYGLTVSFFIAAVVVESSQVS